MTGPETFHTCLILLKAGSQDFGTCCYAGNDRYQGLPYLTWVTHRWVVRGDPGAGKTTLLRHLAAARVTSAVDRGRGHAEPTARSLSIEGPGIESLGAGVEDVPADLDELVESGDPASARVFLDRYPDRAPAFLERVRGLVAPKAVEYHQFKYAVALEDETAPTHQRWTSRLLAPALGYLPTRKTDDNDLTTRSTHALRKAGAL